LSHKYIPRHFSGQDDCIENIAWKPSSQKKIPSIAIATSNFLFFQAGDAILSIVVIFIFQLMLAHLGL